MVRRTCLDFDLIHWFAHHGKRIAVLAAISLARRERGEDDPLLKFLEQHITTNTPEDLS